MNNISFADSARQSEQAFMDATSTLERMTMHLATPSVYNYYVSLYPEIANMQTNNERALFLLCRRVGQISVPAVRDVLGEMEEEKKEEQSLPELPPLRRHNAIIREERMTASNRRYLSELLDNISEYSNDESLILERVVSDLQSHDAMTVLDEEVDMMEEEIQSTMTKQDRLFDIEDESLREKFISKDGKLVLKNPSDLESLIDRPFGLGCINARNTPVWKRDKIDVPLLSLLLEVTKGDWTRANSKLFHYHKRMVDAKNNTSRIIKPLAKQAKTHLVTELYLRQFLDLFIKEGKLTKYFKNKFWSKNKDICNLLLKENGIKVQSLSEKKQQNAFLKLIKEYSSNVKSDISDQLIQQFEAKSKKYAAKASCIRGRKIFYEWTYNPSEFIDGVNHFEYDKKHRVLKKKREYFSTVHGELKVSPPQPIAEDNKLKVLAKDITSLLFDEEKKATDGPFLKHPYKTVIKVQSCFRSSDKSLRGAITSLAEDYLAGYDIVRKKALLHVLEGLHEKCDEVCPSCLDPLFTEVERTILDPNGGLVFPCTECCYPIHANCLYEQLKYYVKEGQVIRMKCFHCQALLPGQMEFLNHFYNNGKQFRFMIESYFIGFEEQSVKMLPLWLHEWVMHDTNQNHASLFWLDKRLFFAQVQSMTIDMLLALMNQRILFDNDYPKDVGVLSKALRFDTPLIPYEQRKEKSKKNWKKLDTLSIPGMQLKNTRDLVGWIGLKDHVMLNQFNGIDSNMSKDQMGYWNIKLYDAKLSIELLQKYHWMYGYLYSENCSFDPEVDYVENTRLPEYLRARVQVINRDDPRTVTPQLP